jgi:hypothetical protein
LGIAVFPGRTLKRVFIMHRDSPELDRVNQPWQLPRPPDYWEH